MLAGIIYDIYVSPSDDGRYGSQIWIRRQAGLDVISWRHHGPRIVCVSSNVTDTLEKVLIFSAHAPTETDKSEVKMLFGIP